LEGQWEFNITWGNYGCFGESFEVANYNLVKLEAG